jgi:hypothetical protein
VCAQAQLLQLQRVATAVVAHAIKQLSTVELLPIKSTVDEFVEDVSSADCVECVLGEGQQQCMHLSSLPAA